MNHARELRSFLMRILVWGVALGLPALAAAAGLEQRESFSTDQLRLRNLIGEIRVEGHTGSGFEVLVTAGGGDAAEGKIRLESTERSLDIEFPEGQTSYVYPRLGHGESVNLKTSDGGGWISELLGGILGTGRIRVRGSGSGTELWADVTVRVPAGGRLEVQHGVGRVLAEGVKADLELSTRSGSVRLENSRGNLSVATGSGDVKASRAGGDRLSIATGSGEVHVSDCDSERLQVATGSGDVRLTGFLGDSVQAATGSGDVEALDVEGDRVEIATGSGSVTLKLRRIGSGDFSVATGSGDVELSLPQGASAEIHAETDRGEIRVELDDPVEFRRREPEEVRLTVGDGAASVDVGTGSGDISIHH